MIDFVETDAVVFLVDDDPGVRDAIEGLFRSVGLPVVALASPKDFLAQERPDKPSCLVLDVRLPGTSGLDFQDELNDRNIEISIVFISAHGDIPMTVRALKAGAVSFLQKPFRDQELVDAVCAGLAEDHERRSHAASMEGVRTRLEALTQREREVLNGVVAGLMNKQIAAELGVSEITVKVHRGAMMRKMGAKSLADLVRIVSAIGAPSFKARLQNT